MQNKNGITIKFPKDVHKWIVKNTLNNYEKKKVLRIIDFQPRIIEVIDITQKKKII